MGGSETALSAAEQALVRGVVLRESGIALGEDKGYLLDARVEALCRRERIAARALLSRIREGEREAIRLIVEALTTNETSFFRDPPVFDAIITQLLAHVVDRKPEGPIRIWCGATSTGQEPYSLAMAVMLQYPAAASRVEILATDLDTQALQRAREGLYSRVEVERGLPDLYQGRFTTVDKMGRYRVRDDVRGMIRFSQQNLLDDLSMVGARDLILLRNVLIYFSADTKNGVLQRLVPLLGQDGLLVLGATESVAGTDTPLESVKFGRCIAYRLRSTQPAHGNLRSS